jgi:hypothetical protein
MSWPAIALSISILLWLFAPYYRRITDSVVWPRIEGWWGTRSKSKLQNRIALLREEMRKSESLPLLTEFENLVLLAFSGVVTLIALAPGMVFVAYLMAKVQPYVLLPSLQDSFYGLWTIVYMLLGLGVRLRIERFRLERSELHRTKLRNDIEPLHARLLN